MKPLQSLFTSLFHNVLRQPPQHLNTTASRAVPKLTQHQPPPTVSNWPLVAGLVMLIPLILSVLFVLT